jgi:hypothetical protein
MNDSERVAKISSQLVDLAIFVEETRKGKFLDVEKRLELVQVRCHELGGELFKLCGESDTAAAERVECQRKTVENICHTCTKAPDDCFPDEGECPYYEATVNAHE